MTPAEQEIERLEREGMQAPDAIDFFRALGFEDGDVLLWSAPKKRSVRFSTIDEAEQVARSLSDAGEQVYFHVCKHVGEILAHERGRIETASAVPCLFADVDLSVKGPAYPDKETALRALASMPFQPSAIVRTSGGFHVYWFFREPLALVTIEDREFAKALLKGWQSLLRARLEKKLDDTAELARVLRVPGTKAKDGSLVAIVEWNAERRYNPDDFSPWAIEVAAPPTAERPRVDPAAILAGVPEGDRDNKLWSYACSLRARRINRAEADTLVVAAARGCKPAFSERVALEKVERAWKFPVGTDGSRAVTSAPEATAADSATEPGGPTEPLWRRPAEVLDAIPQPKARFLTPFPALNKASRGGLPTGRIVVVQGEPDAGKTGKALQLAVSIGVEHDVPVWIYTSDGGEAATAVRVGGLLGFDMERLENRDPAEKALLAHALSDRRIFIVSDSAEAANLEHLIIEAEKLDPDAPHVLCLDSIQETPPRAEAAPTERDTVNANTRLLRKARQSKVPWLIIATSEVVKSSFASKRGSERSRQIAAGSDSAKIGYAADLVIHLSGDPGEAPDFGRAAVVKTKLGGGKAVYGLRLDRPSLRLIELDIAAVDEDRVAREEAKAHRDLKDLSQRALAYLAGHGEVNESDLRRALKVQAQRLREAIAFAGTRITMRKGPRNSNLYGTANR